MRIFLALPPGVEPRSQAPEASILSIELRKHPKKRSDDLEADVQSQMPFVRLGAVRNILLEIV